MCDEDSWDLKPDTDPMKPPEEPIDVECIHCRRRYRSDAIVWDERWRMWVCPHPDCGGAGFGFDIWPLDRDYFIRKWKEAGCPEYDPS